MTAITNISTRRLITVVTLIAVAAGVCEIRGPATWQKAPPLSQLFDRAGFLLFWLSYMLFAILLVVGPFRPRTTFSLHGECGARAANFFLALGIFLLLNLWLVLAYLLA